MTAAIIQLAASFAAVLLLVWVVHWAGFSRAARLAGEYEARELASLTPGGFTATRVALDRDGKGAIATDAAGRLVLLRADGGQFLPELVPVDALSADGDSLRIALNAADRTVILNIGPDAAGWPAPEHAQP